MELGIQKFLNTVNNCNCLDFIERLPENSLDSILIDPPYGEKMGYDGDSTITEAQGLLSHFLRSAYSKTKQNSHVAIFWTMRNLDICIETLKSSGFTFRRVVCMYLPKGNARPYLGWLPRTQAIVIGQKYLPLRPPEFHRNLAAYLSKAISDSGISKSEIARKLGCDSRLVMKWTRIGDPAWCLPTPRFFKPLKDLLSLDDSFDILLVREPGKQIRSDFDYKHDVYVVDDNNLEMLHPSQKPLSVIEHLVTCICPEKGVVLDGFAGSGTTGVACKNTKRNYILSEISKEYCNICRQRLELDNI